MSTTGVFAFNDSTAGSVNTSLTSLMTSLHESLNDLGGFVRAVKANWDGDEMEMYASIQQRWDESAKTVEQVLDGVHQALGGVQKGFGDVRKQIQDAMKEG